MLKGKNIVLGVSGGIAAYKTPQLVRLLKKAGANVRVALTASGSRFVSELALATLSQEPVLQELFVKANQPGADFTAHISIGEWADALVVAPATANTLARLAAGLSDDMLSACFITLRPGRPVLLFPAMDGEMYRSASVQRNIATLAGDGCLVEEPASGELASGLCGLGRMPEPEAIVLRLEESLSPVGTASPLSGKRLVVTAGPTREKIDGVRFISNYSSGKMGFAIARAAARRGAEVQLVSGPVALQTPERVQRIEVESALEMDAAVQSISDTCDVLIAAAAVADYRPMTPFEGKLKKNDPEMEIRLVRNPDILAGFGARKKPGQLAVGFALETEGGIGNAIGKLEAKNLDLIAFNTFERERSGFEVDTNMLTLIGKGEEPVELPLMSKDDGAGALLDVVERLLQASQNNH